MRRTYPWTAWTSGSRVRHSPIGTPGGLYFRALVPVRMSFNLIPPWTIPKQFKGQGSPQSGFGWALVPSTCREVRLAYFILSDAPRRKLAIKNR